METINPVGSHVVLAQEQKTVHTWLSSVKAEFQKNFKLLGSELSDAGKTIDSFVKELGAPAMEAFYKKQIRAIAHDVGRSTLDRYQRCKALESSIQDHLCFEALMEESLLETELARALIAEQYPNASKEEQQRFLVAKYGQPMSIETFNKLMNGGTHEKIMLGHHAIMCGGLPKEVAAEQRATISYHVHHLANVEEIPAAQYLMAMSLSKHNDAGDKEKVLNYLRAAAGGGFFLAQKEFATRLWLKFDATADESVQENPVAFKLLTDEMLKWVIHCSKAGSQDHERLMGVLLIDGFIKGEDEAQSKKLLDEGVRLLDSCSVRGCHQSSLKLTEYYFNAYSVYTEISPLNIAEQLNALKSALFYANRAKSQCYHSDQTTIIQKSIDKNLLPPIYSIRQGFELAKEDVAKQLENEFLNNKEPYEFKLQALDKDLATIDDIIDTYGKATAQQEKEKEESLEAAAV